MIYYMICIYGGVASGCHTIGKSSYMLALWTIILLSCDHGVFSIGIRGRAWTCTYTCIFFSCLRYHGGRFGGMALLELIFASLCSV